MKPIFFFLLLTLGLWLGAQAQRNVYVNGLRLEDQVVSALEQYYQVRIQPGHYWYDSRNGWWGAKGQAVAGVIAPGLNLGGSLSSQASGGRTGVFINGRQVNRSEWQHLSRIVGQPIAAGRYWVDAYGNAGLEGGWAQVNLYQAAQRSSSAYSRSFSTDVGYGSNGRDFYIMGEDFSYTNF